MKEIFPIEIVEYTNEKYWSKRNIKSKIIYLSIICVLLLTIISLPFIYVDISSQSRGNIRSVDENNVLQSVASAEIKQINLAENQYVKEGDTLVWLRTDAVDEQISRLRERQNENTVFMEDIDRIIEGKTSRIVSPKYKSEYAQSYSKVRKQEIVMVQAESEYNVSKKLYNTGVESRFDYDKNYNQLEIARSQVSSVRRELNASWHAERTKLELENRDLGSDLRRLTKDKKAYYLVAPISGNVVQYIGVKEGNFITAGQSLAQIASTSNLIAECYISTSDIGYVRVGQDVKFQMDAFDYQQWGLLSGNVTEIISDVVTIDNMPVYRVRCSIDSDHLILRNGYKGYLKKGMTLTGRFVLTERSLAQLLFDKVDNWMNPKIIN